MIFALFSLMVIAYWMWPKKRDHFAEFRKRPMPKFEGKEPIKNPSIKSEPSRIPANKKRQHEPQLRPLDSRSVAATSIREAVEDQLVDNDPINIRGGKYLRSKNVYAVRKADWNENDPAIIKSFAGHYLIRSETPISGGLPVLINTKNSRYAIVTKVLKVKLKDLSLRDSLFQIPFQIVETYPHISVVLYQFEDLDSLLLADEEAKKNQQVKRSNIEILENMRTGR